DTLSDLDLLDGNSPRGGSDDSGSNGKIEGFTLRQYKFDMAFNSEKCIQTSLFFSASKGAIAGIVSAVAATVIGAVSSFIAYQKKKLCFKQGGKNS
ncbi:C99L2 protein, partial [Machaerirhynchus nigripectus]|nr:C99L2 protein [Machaerirhynchus nigripectus]